MSELCETLIEQNDTPAEPLARVAAGIAEKARHLSVVVVGDLMLDEYIFGHVERISPEAPVPVVRVERVDSRAGGAANAAAGIRALGAGAVILGVVGADSAAEKLRAALSRQGLSSEHLIEDAGRPTCCKTRVIAGSQQVVRTDIELDDEIGEELRGDLVRRARTALAGADALVLSDYGKGVITTTMAQDLICAARTLRIPVVVDPKGHDLLKYRGATVITPNLGEAMQLARPHGVDTNDKLATAMVLRDVTDNVLITAGADGMLLLESQASSLYVIPAVAKEVFDVTGAGDTVVAMLAVALASGASVREAARSSAAAAGVVVGKIGTASAVWSEL